MADVFEYAVVTLKGLALQAKVAGGGNIEFTKVVTGAGSVDPVLMQNQTAVSQPMQEFFYSVEPTFSEDAEVILSVVISNDEVTTGYDCYQLGVYATDPDDGEILYAIIQGGKPLSVPTAKVLPGWTAEFNLYLQYGNADSVTVVVDEAGLLTVSVADGRYLQKQDAEDTYLKQTAASNTYLNKIDASTTYLKQTDAEKTYLNKTDADTKYLDKDEADKLYLSTEYTPEYVIGEDEEGIYIMKGE